ncbi:hypothetical protein F383_32358 [Gossypium arboreum]|uniref:Uncharacterized protein n=1 Tax=Gossypium arboreum TaxID=29729 RepID=A0A0B0PK28_GOSAR|nr:hypothetical protein F383_11795 [Gossypium arboreum]KHG25262.1 hypothetical protein F383_32358 [Gossypium arboreum]
MSVIISPNFSHHNQGVP